jgi:hypothetical protein
MSETFCGGKTLFFFFAKTWKVTQMSGMFKMAYGDKVCKEHKLVYR